MTILNYVFGIATLLSAIMAIAQHIGAERKKVTEECKVHVLRTRLDDIHNSLLPALYSLDRLCRWLNSREAIDRHGLYRNIRTVHVQIETIALVIQAERARLSSWRFGLYTPSDYTSQDIGPAAKAAGAADAATGAPETDGQRSSSDRGIAGSEEATELEK